MCTYSEQHAHVCIYCRSPSLPLLQVPQCGLAAPPCPPCCCLEHQHCIACPAQPEATKVFKHTNQDVHVHMYHTCLSFGVILWVYPPAACVPGGILLQPLCMGVSFCSPCALHSNLLQVWPWLTSNIRHIRRLHFTSESISLHQSHW